MKDWKIIFNTRNYHYILIKEKQKELYLNFFFKHQNQIDKVNSFFLMMPTKDEINNISNNNYVMKYAPLLKSFINDSTKTTLFIEEDVLRAIVKEDKLLSFFKYISKNNKNIVLFYYSDIDQYPKSLEYSKLITNQNELENQLDVFKRFYSIKNQINKTYDPFKDPITAFNKIQSENNND